MKNNEEQALASCGAAGLLSLRLAQIPAAKEFKAPCRDKESAHDPTAKA
jgi:hypothetical protein